MTRYDEGIHNIVVSVCVKKCYFVCGPVTFTVAVTVENPKPVSNVYGVFDGSLEGDGEFHEASGFEGPKNNVWLWCMFCGSSLLFP